jgi:hypothetical protein
MTRIRTRRRCAARILNFGVWFESIPERYGSGKPLVAVEAFAHERPEAVGILRLTA